MASVIRVNTINSRSGLSTVTFDNSGAGVEVAGIVTATGVIDAQGYINLAQKIIHTGDADTSIEFPSNDTIKFETAGGERLRIDSDGKAIFSGAIDANSTFELSGIANFDSTVKVSDKIEHLGDSNTAIRFPAADVISFERGGGEALRITTANALLTAGVTAEPLYPHFATARKIQAEIKGAIDPGNTRHHGSLAVNCTNSNSFIGLVRSDNTQTDGTDIGVIGWTGFDGTDFHQAAAIMVKKGAGAGNDDQPGHMIFKTNSGTTSATERLRITSDGVIQTPGTTKIKTHSVGIGTTATINTGVGTAYGEMMYNTTTNSVQVYTTTNLWYNVSDLQGYYKTAAAASSDGMNHYWGGSSSTSIISGLTPSGSPDGAPNTPTFNHTAQSYYGDYPYFDFASGNSQVGYMFLKSGTKWGAGPFTICFWVDLQGVTMESESTYVQLGSHAGLRSMYSVSVDADRKLKAITIGDDTGVSSDAQLIGNTWHHVAVTYNTSRVTKYYMDGTLVRSHTHSSALDVGTSSQYIYLGYGYWNSSAGNKAAIAHMSDIGIWDAKELNATEIKNIYNAKRIIRGY